jgi:hypothetical protein
MESEFLSIFNNSEEYEKYAIHYFREYQKNNSQEVILKAWDPCGKQINSMLAKKDTMPESVFSKELRSLLNNLSFEFISKLLDSVRQKAPRLRNSILHENITELDALLQEMSPHSALLLNFPLNQSETTALHLATAKKHIPAIHILVKNGARIDIQNKLGFTPLHYASANNSPDSARTLLDLGAKVDVKDNLQATPLHYAEIFQHDSIIKLLTAHDTTKVQK